jgi:hypothetical protein
VPAEGLKLLHPALYSLAQLLEALLSIPDVVIGIFN